MNTVLFDLDGTLLPMDQDLFIKAYMEALSAKMHGYGFRSDQLVNAVWQSTKAMIENDGVQTNEQCFWDSFTSIFGDEIKEMESVFFNFYENEFLKIKEHTTPTPLAKECINILKDKGYQMVLATNPVFPKIATMNRIKWAGLDPEDFVWITTYETSSFCKPNLKYYEEILKKIGKSPEDCIMIGNDVQEDMCAARLGMQVFLLKDHLIHNGDTDISAISSGNWIGLLEYINDLPVVKDTI